MTTIRRSLFTLGLVAAVPAVALATDRNWSNSASSNDWNTSSNWVENAVPASGQDVYIEKTAQNPVQVDTSQSTSLHRIQLDAVAAQGNVGLSIVSPGVLGCVTGSVTGSFELIAGSHNGSAADNVTFNLGAGASASFAADSISMTGGASDTIRGDRGAVFFDLDKNMTVTSGGSTTVQSGDCDFDILSGKTFTARDFIIVGDANVQLLSGGTMSCTSFQMNGGSNGSVMTVTSSTLTAN